MAIFQTAFSHMNTHKIISFLKKNLTFGIGMTYFVLCVLICFTGYLFLPDTTPNANRQQLSLAKLPPGAKAFVLKIPTPTEKTGFLTQLMYGKPDDCVFVPLNASIPITLKGDSVSFQLYQGGVQIKPLSLWAKVSSQAEFVAQNTENLHFYLGTDGYGRDVLSRLVLGGRVSILIGLLAGLMSVLLGTCIGLVAGYAGGKTDDLIMWFISVMWSIPTLLMAIVLGFVMGTGWLQLVLAIALSGWVEAARLVRGQVMSVKEQTYIEATKALGYGTPRVLFKHLLPNVIQPVIVIAVANFGSAILIESGLSFLGLGVELGVPTWGRMIYEGYTYILFAHGKWLAIFPGLALTFLVIAINWIGNGLREIMV